MADVHMILEFMAVATGTILFAVLIIGMIIAVFIIGCKLIERFI